MSILYEYLIRIIIALSVLLNVILGGHSNQSFSARNFYWKQRGMFNLVGIIDFIAWFDPNHCEQSYILFECFLQTSKACTIHPISNMGGAPTVAFYTSIH